MGNRFQLTAVSEEEKFANDCIDKGIAEIQRIERLLTTFNEESETALINRYAGIEPTSVSEETFCSSNDLSEYPMLHRAHLILLMVQWTNDYGILTPT